MKGHKLCRMCGCYTKTVVNISFSAVSICDACCDTITKQNVIDLINRKKEIGGNK